MKLNGWQRVGIVLLIALLCATSASVTYYYAFFLPEQDKQREKREHEKANLERQEKCAKQAREEFRNNGWEKQPMSSFINHYNEKLNKCFMVIESTDASTASDTIFVNKSLTDAFEGKIYAQYMWKSKKDKKYWEVPPIICTMTLPSGEEKICHSSDEFDELVKYYMQ